MRTPTPDATVILLVCIACIWCPSGCLSDETDTHDAVAVIATALDVDPARVAIQDSQPRDQGAARRVLAEISDDAGPARKVIAEYEVPGGLVRHLSWPNGRVPRPGQPISIDVALERAHELMDRLFPSVPCEMALLHAEPLGSFVAADGVSPPLMYHFLWQGNAPEGASTGDTVAVFISAVTGEPVAYHQRVASKRPQLGDIAVSREQAARAAVDSTTSMWRQARGIAVKATVEDVRLVLSSPVSPDNGPVWLVNMTVTHEARGEELERTQRAVDAMSGEILR